MKYPFMFVRGSLGTDRKVCVLIADYELTFLETWTMAAKYLGKGQECQNVTPFIEYGHVDPGVEIHEFTYEWEALQFIQNWWSNQPKITEKVTGRCPYWTGNADGNLPAHLCVLGAGHAGACR